MILSKKTRKNMEQKCSLLFKKLSELPHARTEETHDKPHCALETRLKHGTY